MKLFLYSIIASDKLLSVQLLTRFTEDSLYIFMKRILSENEYIYPEILQVPKACRLFLSGYMNFI